MTLWLAGLLLEEPPAAEAELAGRMEEELMLMEAAEEEEELEAELEDELALADEEEADGAGDDAPDAAATG